MVKALISIEDKRFYEHNGVDWYGTLGQVKNMLTGGEVRGASTITQQLIKNTTGNKQVTIRRKILEIFQALRAHENYSEEDILENYLNLVYFGHKAYGIEAAAETYFGKHVEDLTIAEGAAIVGITQNPWQYDPLRSDWSRGQNRKRQLTVLSEMHEQGWITDAQYQQAKNEPMNFATEGNAETNENVELDSFFVEQVFRDVVKALEEKGYATDVAQMLLYNGGYKIYCTLDPDIQNMVESVYADQNNFNYQSEKGEMLQSGMTIIDNATGNVVAIAGRVGERKGAFELSYATAANQCGSAIKPLSVYAPSLDAGLITAASVIDDYPVMELNGNAWPVNAYTGYRGIITLQDALRISSNTTAVRTFLRLTPAASYAFLEDKLGITTLVNDDVSAAGALALGGLTRGVNTVEMAAAYATFANNGVYSRPRTFTEVRDSYGNVIIDNKQESWVAMKETTVYTINELLKNVMSDSGTGKAARFGGMTQAGKTGTTNSRRDKYFVGYTPYYTAAVWCGFPHPARIETNDNPAAIAWNKVMSRLHEGLEDKDFPTTSDGMVRVTVCNKTGLLAGSGCSATRTVLVPEGAAPTLTCDAHVTVDFCTEGQAPATQFCPEDLREQRSFLDLTAPNTATGFGYTRELILRSLSEAQYADFAAQVEAGVRETIPEGMPIAASDSDQMLAELPYLNTCMVHLAPVEEQIDPLDPDNPFNPYDPNNPYYDPLNPLDPNNPLNPFNPLIPGETDPNGGQETPGEEEKEEDNSYAEYLDENLDLNNP